jgi:hypothetical protein
MSEILKMCGVEPQLCRFTIKKIIVKVGRKGQRDLINTDKMNSKNNSTKVRTNLMNYTKIPNRLRLNFLTTNAQDNQS